MWKNTITFQDNEFIGEFSKSLKKDIFIEPDDDTDNKSGNFETVSKLSSFYVPPPYFFFKYKIFIATEIFSVKIVGKKLKL